jgi:hypothetical protein
VVSTEVLPSVIGIILLDSVASTFQARPLDDVGIVCGVANCVGDLDGMADLAYMPMELVVCEDVATIVSTDLPRFSGRLGCCAGCWLICRAGALRVKTVVLERNVYVQTHKRGGL